MAFTVEDLNAVETAIATLGMGESVVEVSIAGKTFRYGEASLNNLLRIRVMMQRELGLVPGTVYPKNVGRARS